MRHIINIGERDILSLKTKCDNTTNGCEWSGELRSLDEHLTNCDFSLLSCPNKCKEVEQLLRKDMEKHKMECLRRQYDCPHCEEAGEYEERTTSHLNECPMIEVPCPKRECKESILRRNITEHLSKCMFEDIPCKYANIGCKEKVIRRDLHQLEKHEGESQQHLQLAIDAVQQQQRAISDMTAQIQYLQKKQPQLSELNLPLKLKRRRRKDLPFGMWGYPTVAVLKEKVYIGGGWASSDREEQTVIVYDPKQDSYDTLPPYTCKWFSMAVVNNQLVLVGGRDVQTMKVTNKLGVWNEQSKRWTHPLPPMTTACSSPSVATHNNRWLVVMGGITRLSRVEILDTDSTQWYHAASLPQPLSHSLPALIGNMCYLLGGYTKGDIGDIASKKVFSVCLDDLISQAVSQPASASTPPTPSPWQSLPDTPLDLSTATALAFNGGLLAAGRKYGSTVIYHYQPSSRSWVKAGELPTKQCRCTYTVLPSGDLYVAGGDCAEQRVDIALVQ